MANHTELPKNKRVAPKVVQRSVSFAQDQLFELEQTRSAMCKERPGVPFTVSDAIQHALAIGLKALRDARSR